MITALHDHTTMWNRFPIVGPLTLATFAAAASVMIAVMPFETILAIALFLSGICAGARRPDLGLALIALSVPIQRTLLVGFGDTAVTITKVVLWSTIGGWLWNVAVRRDSMTLDLVSWAAIGVAGALAVSGWNARDGGLWIGETYRWLAMIPVGVFAVTTFRQGWSPLPFLASSVLGTVFCVASAGWQVIAQVGPPSFESRGIMRATGPFGHPNQLAIYLELTVPLLLGVILVLWRTAPVSILSTKAKRLLPLWVTGVILGMVGLVFSQSRGGSVGMLVGIGVTIAMASLFVSRHARFMILVALAGTVFVVSWLILYVHTGALTSAARGVLVTPSNFAVEERLAHWAAAVEMAARNPVLGVGAGNYDMNFREATTTWRFRIGRGHAHNSYMQMLAQSGTVGLASYFILIVAVGVTLVDAVRCSMASVLARGIAIGVAGMSAALLAHAVFEYVHVLSLNLYMAIAWGLVAAIASGSVDSVQSVPPTGLAP